MDYVFLALVCTYFWGCSIYSIVAPLYPTVAKDRGMEDGLIGVLFATFSLMGFLVSPLNGKLMARIGRKSVLIGGSLLEIIGMLFFGFVYYMSGTSFILLSFLSRIMQGIGGSALFVACLSIIASRYPSQVETKLGIIESLGSIGLIVGPMLGVLIYEFTGYVWVFIIYSGIHFLMQVLLMFILPREHYDEDNKPGISYKEYFKVSEVVMVLGAVIFSMGGLTFIEPVLSSFLKDDMKLGKVIIGVAFCLPTVGYALAVLLQAILSQRSTRKYIIATGLLLEGVSFVLICQEGVFQMEDNIYITGFSLVLMGMGTALIFLPALPYMVDIMITRIPDSNREELNDSLSTIMGTAHFLGESIGPMIAGYFVEFLGYEFGFLVFAGLTFLYLVVFIFVLVLCRSKRDIVRTSETPTYIYEPLKSSRNNRRQANELLEEEKD